MTKGIVTEKNGLKTTGTKGKKTGSPTNGRKTGPMPAKKTIPKPLKKADPKPLKKDGPKGAKMTIPKESKHKTESTVDNLKRCSWPGNDALYIKYHDEEWGRQTRDEKKLFEFLILEAAQAGLSWITILRRREGYRKAFAHFNVKKVAAFDEEDVKRLLNDEGIIRNRLKIHAAIGTAKLFIEVQNEFGSFYNYLYRFMPEGRPIVNYTGRTPVSTSVSDAISKDMKKRGFKFFGTTICYAFMQAVGMVNDHLPDCAFKGAN